MLPLVWEAVPKESQEVGRDRSLEYLLENLETVCNLQIFADAVLSRFIFVSALDKGQNRADGHEFTFSYSNQADQL